MSRNIVLDLDECLIHTFVEDLDWTLYRRLKANTKTKNRVAKITFNNTEFWTVKRPHLDEFIEFCFDNFETVSVWSAGVPAYVEAVVSCIFKRRPHLVMTRDNVLYEHRTEKELGYSKPLMFYFEKMPRATRENTILVDDRRENSKYDPENIVHIPEYDVLQDQYEIESDERSLRDLMDWLKLLTEEADIRCSDHSSAFMNNL